MILEKNRETMVEENGKQFAEFRVGDLFEVENIQMFNKQEVLPEGDTPYITRSAKDNGISGYANDPNSKKVNRGNVITFGAESVKFYYQKVPFVAGNKMYFVTHEKLNRRIAMYLISVFEKTTQKTFGYSNGLTGTKFSELSFTLPVTGASADTDSPEPDWEYMENYIKGIEEEYLDSVVKYNKRNGEILDALHPDYHGSAPEAYDYAEFRVGDVFEIVTGSMVKNLKEGTIPRINPTEQNNGIGSWIEDNNPLARYFEDFVSVSFLGNVFYQGQRSSLEMKVHGLKRKDGFLGYRKGTYVTTSVLKAISGVYNYGMQLSSEKLKDVTITLPITPGGEPDWDFMEDYIDYIAGGGRSRIARYVQHKKSASSGS